MHYGLVPRANRGIFAINELPDLAGKIQVGLFNIMQEGDVQIKGYPVRLPLDLLLVFTANPGGLYGARQDHHAAEGPHRQRDPDALSGDARTRHRDHARARPGSTGRPEFEVRCRTTSREIIEQLAFSAREDKRVDKRSGVSQRLPISVTENVVSNAERRAMRERRPVAVPRVLDIYAAMPAITGKIELEYEGELKGGDAVSRELIRAAVGKVYDRYFEGVNMQPVVQWFDIGGILKLGEDVHSAEVARQLNAIQGLMEKTRALGFTANEPDAVRASAGEFILEGSVRASADQPLRRARICGGGAKRPAPEPEEESRSAAAASV